MRNRDIIIILLVILAVTYYLQQRPENLDASSLSSEAIQNIASVYGNTSGTAVFNNIKVTGTADIANISSLKGIIVMWSGSNTPAGWALCDGTNGTPDLRGKFVLGSGQGTGLTSRLLGDKGGEETHLLTLDEIPAHNHDINTSHTDNKNSLWHINTDKAIATGVDNGYVQRKNPPAIFSSGGGKAHSIMPPYYVLAYIMKL